MNAVELVKIAVEDLHRGFQSEVAPLTPEQIVYRPNKEANTIAFLLWHFSQSEDNFVHRQVQHQAPLWEQEQWHQRLGLQPGDSGATLNAEQIGAFSPVKEELLAYNQRVLEAARAAISSLSDSDLDRLPNPERPQMPLGRGVANLILGHGFWHLGEIRFLKGLQGMPFGR